MEYQFKLLLIFDDDPVSQFILHTIIKRKPFFAKAVHLYTDSLQVTNLLKEKNIEVPELIFLCIDIPGKNRDEFLEEIISLSTSNTARIVLMSNSPKDRVIDQLLTERKIIAFFQKPLISKDLDELIISYKKSE
jgi:response regulator of citrate/malate metabolism